MKDIDFKWGLRDITIDPQCTLDVKARVCYTVFVFTIAFGLPIATDVEAAEHHAPHIFKQLLNDETAYLIGNRVDDIGDDVEQVLKFRQMVADNPLMAVTEQPWRSELVSANCNLTDHYAIMRLTEQLRSALS